MYVLEILAFSWVLQAPFGEVYPNKVAINKDMSGHKISWIQEPRDPLNSPTTPSTFSKDVLYFDIHNTVI